MKIGYGYKLFEMDTMGKLYPLFIGKNKETKIGEWIPAENIPTKGSLRDPVGIWVWTFLMLLGFVDMMVLTLGVIKEETRDGNECGVCVNMTQQTIIERKL